MTSKSDYSGLPFDYLIAEEFVSNGIAVQRLVGPFEAAHFSVNVLQTVVNHMGLPDLVDTMTVTPY